MLQNQLYGHGMRLMEYPHLAFECTSVLMPGGFKYEVHVGKSGWLKSA